MDEKACDAEIDTRFSRCRAILASGEMVMVYGIQGDAVLFWRDSSRFGTNNGLNAAHRDFVRILPRGPSKLVWPRVG